ncbi:MAG: M3 family metallopeptidase [Bdellovibrionaceae bacterium]|nr:M3 family metallopeptidase [Pseudobdellovibrionaceae bacterium]
MMSQNPLIAPLNLFDQALPFDKIQAEHFIPAVEYWIIEAKKNIQHIIDNPAAPTFENVIFALEKSSERLDQASTTFGNLEVAHGDEKIHELSKKIYPLLASFSSDITLNAALFQKIKHVHDHRKDLQLDSESMRLLEKTYLSFARNGALLSPDKKDSLRKIDQELSTLGPQFSENVLKDTNAFELILTSADLTGLPESATEAAKDLAESKGHSGRYLFNLQMPSYLPLITYSSRRDIREHVFRAYNSRATTGAHANQELIKKILQLKSQRSQLLGFKNHADFVLQERMAQTAEQVTGFLKRLQNVSKSAAQKDLQEIVDFAKNTDGIADFRPWDFAYYSEKLKEKKYAFNEEDLRPYFRLENVVNGVFEHARRLYGIVFKENTQLPVYHPDVKCYEIYREDNQTYLGLFYTDFFPRQTKKGGAWMTLFRSQGYFEGTIHRPHVSIVCNFTKPTSTKPSLLTYDEVRTLFHEFGHALHGILSDCKYQSLGGTNVYWDFVELPSQIMENWVNEKESLDLYAHHYETNELIPKDLVGKLVYSQKYLAGWASLRQIQLGTLDMLWHMTDPNLISNVEQFEDQAVSDFRLLPKVEGTNVSCSFSHIFAGGYSAGYYSYKWAEVLDADAFEYFKEKGIFNHEVAARFRDNILSRGGSEHPMELYKKFRGREPDADALLRRDGLI